MKNIKAIFGFILALCMLIAAFAACKGPEQSLENETAQPTLEATAEPTTAPDEASLHDIEMLREFFDTPSKVEGKTNGQLLFENYDSTDPKTWFLSDGVTDSPDLPGEFIYWKGWTEYNEVIDYLCKISTNFLVLENKVLNFGGTLKIDGCEYLDSISLSNITADELIITNCKENIDVDIMDSNSNTEFNMVLIDIYNFSSYAMPCAKEYRLVLIYDEYNFDINITALADGDGLVCVSSEFEEGGNYLFIRAEASEGSHFVGWYDIDGNLVTDSKNFRIADWSTSIGISETATYTAKFEND